MRECAMEHIYLFTGYPGFISNQLIRELIKTDSSFQKIIALVLPSQRLKADIERERIIAQFQLENSQFELIEGDITKQSLDLAPNMLASLQESITHLFHLAAIYDLAVPKNIAYLVNVDGTNNVNQFALHTKKLARYVYFSTAFVAGTREGVIREDELIKPEAFKNYYEETKYIAEVSVQAVMDQLPVTIIRPAIVKGHTETGETIKFDGPYFILNLLDKLRHLPIIPYLTTSKSIVNMVPVDFIIKAVSYLSIQPIGVGKVYHLTDPNPYNVTQLYEMFMETMVGKKPIGRLPLVVSKTMLSIKPIRQFFKVEKEAIDYFTYMGLFDSSQSQADLAGSGISCPDFKQGVEPMVEYYQQNKQNAEYQVQIL